MGRDTLTLTVADAIDFAQEGKVADGYTCLVWACAAPDLAQYKPPQFPLVRHLFDALQ